MGKLVPVLAAFLLLCSGIQYFRVPKLIGDGPLMSSYIFMFAAFMLLWDVRLYPKSLRKLGIISQCVFEFFVASFLLENIMADFWFPLELVVLRSGTALADFLEGELESGNWPCDEVCNFLREENTAFLASYLLSVFILLAVLHATRAIDLRMLEYGPFAFFGDILLRTKKYFRRQKRHLGIGMKKRVQIKEITDRKSAPARSSSDYCGKNNNKSNNAKKNNKKKDPCAGVLKSSSSDLDNDYC